MFQWQPTEIFYKFSRPHTSYGYSVLKSEELRPFSQKKDGLSHRIELCYDMLTIFLSVNIFRDVLTIFQLVMINLRLQGFYRGVNQAIIWLIPSPAISLVITPFHECQTVVDLEKDHILHTYTYRIICNT